MVARITTAIPAPSPNPWSTLPINSLECHPKQSTLALTQTKATYLFAIEALA